MSLCDASAYAKVKEASAPEPSMDTYEGRLAMVVAHRAGRKAEQGRRQEAERKADDERRQRAAVAQASPECAKARAEHQSFQPADTYSRDFYERNVLPVVCRAEAAEDPSERMTTKEERIATQVELLQSTAKLFVELTGGF